MKQTFESIVQRMADAGYHLECGPHEGLRGYYAYFYLNDERRECECGNQQQATWQESGHADSLLDAVKMGRQLALGVVVKVPGTKDFR